MRKALVLVASLGLAGIVLSTMIVAENHSDRDAIWKRLQDPDLGILDGPSAAEIAAEVYFGIFRGSLPNLLASGDVTPTSAVLWSRRASRGWMIFRYASESSVVRQASVFVDDPLIPAKVLVEGLEPGTEYYYSILGRRTLGRFRTPLQPDTRAGLRFGAGGDSRGELAPYSSVSNAPDRDLDFFINIGDTIYADFPSPAVPQSQTTTIRDFRLKHNEVYAERFGSNPLGSLRSSTPFFVTIDDHEVIEDFAGGALVENDPRITAGDATYVNETELYEQAIQAFSEYNPIVDVTWEGTGDERVDGRPNFYRYRKFGLDAAVFLLDARSFRDEGLPAVQDPTDPAQVIQFLTASFAPGRTLLGGPQLSQLQNDLLDAQALGISWKFIVVPEPIQNLGVLFASDRFEGYAFERSQLLGFILEAGISNVVFISADLHGTLVNNLTLPDVASDNPLANQISLPAFEIVTGASAYDAPLGPTVTQIANAIGLLPDAEFQLYSSLPREGRDAFLQQLLDTFVTGQGYDPLGLEGSAIGATLLEGGYVAAHTYGWTEFEIDAETQRLTITTWGIDWYTEQDLLDNPLEVVTRQPEIVSQFTVEPQR